MIRNFLFHRVNPQRDLLWGPMSVEHFDKCISYISRKYNVVLLEDLLANKFIDTGKKIATICFDDGYKDNLEFAAPILEKYNCKASFYVVTNCIDNNIPTWTHILEYRFLHTNVNEITIDFEFLPAEFHIQALHSKEERIVYVKKLKPYLKKLSHTHRQLILNKIDSTYNDILIPKLMMDWSDLNVLKSKGHYIGSHTVTHCMLGTMDNENEIRNELLVSGNRIKEMLGYFPVTISYPVGSYNTLTISLSKEVGYLFGLAVKQKLYDRTKDGVFEVPRIELYNESWIKTYLRITTVLELIKKFIR